MATINFRVKGNTDRSSILIRFRHGRLIDTEISTGLHVQRKHWSKVKQRVKLMKGSFDYADDINNHLNKLKTKILEDYAKDSSNGVGINQKWLKNQVNNYFSKPEKKEEEFKIFLVPYIEKYIIENKNKLNRKTGKAISKRTFQSYETCKVKLLDFEKLNSIRVQFSEIDLYFHSKFQDFLENKHHLNPNSIGGYFNKIKFFCRKAELDGFKVNPKYRSQDFYSPQNTTKDIYLNLTEIKRITSHDFSKSDRLDNARDWLIIGVWSGLRVSDLLRLDSSFIKDGMINITALKTGINVIIPLHPTVKNILKKRKGEFPRVLSDQKFNKYIKEICKIVGITELVDGYKLMPVTLNNSTIHRKVFGKFPKYDLVSSHICRRSFATNHYGKIDTLTIMKITGHKTEKQFLEYIKRTPTQYAEQLEAFWDSTK